MTTGKEVGQVHGAMVQFGGVVMTAEQFRVVEHTIAPGLDRDEMELFFYECKRRGVHPLDRLIFPIKRNDNSESGGGQKKLTFQCSIDYFRAAAEDTGKYMGQRPVQFGAELSLDQACKAGAGHKDIMVPESATVTVLRRSSIGDDPIEVSATAFWKEYYPGEKMGFMWRKMPKGQLAKCAEALAIRKAFPRELGKLYANEEVERVESDVPFAKASTVREVAPALPPKKDPASSKATAEEGPGDPQGSLSGVAVELPPDVAAMSEVKRKLYIEAVTVCNGNIEEAAGLVREVSEFEGNNNKVHYIDIHDMKKVSDAWAGRALGTLRDRRG